MGAEQERERPERIGLTMNLLQRTGPMTNLLPNLGSIRLPGREADLRLDPVSTGLVAGDHEAAPLARAAENDEEVEEGGSPILLHKQYRSSVHGLGDEKVLRYRPRYLYLLLART